MAAVGMDELSYRQATLADIDFCTAAILEAERSGSPHTVYEKVFDLDRAALSSTVNAMLGEDVPGSELCCESFTIALSDGNQIGCVAAWIENLGNPPSNLIRATLLSHVLGAERWVKAQPRLKLLSEIELKREPGTLQIEAVFVGTHARGKRVTARTIEHVLARCRVDYPQVRQAQIQSVLENERSTRAFSNAGFAIAQRTHSDNAALRALFPGSGRLLWQRAV